MSTEDNNHQEQITRLVFPWKLSIFPVLELIFFISALWVSSSFLSLLLIVIAGILLSFSIHIFFHECVHFRDEYSTSIHILYSLLLGLPFDGYRIHHFNHHTHSNSLKDFSTTWYVTNNEKKPFSACRYTFGWLRQLTIAVSEPEPFDKTMGNVTQIKSRIGPQKIAIIILYMALALISIKAFLLYFALTYFGWAFSALHNYGQHPPNENEPVCTYANKTYNCFFFNNGLHWEHHQKPGLSWKQLTADDNSTRINYPHLINPCMETIMDKT